MKIIRIAAVAAALAALAAAEVQAQVELELTPFAGGTVFLADPPNQFALGRRHNAPLIVGNGSFDDAWTLGLNAGVRINERWAVEGLFSWIPTSLTGTGIVGTEDVNGFMYGVTGLYYFPVDWPVTPFLGLGVGAETFDYQNDAWKTDTEFMGNVVGGLFLPLTEGVGMRFEARDCIARFDSGVTSVNDAWENDLMLTVGFSFRTPIN